MAQTRKLQLADPREGDRELPIEVLIGGDHYSRIVQDASKIRQSSSLVIIPTKFGWILTGNRTGIAANNMMVNHIALKDSEYNLRRFWDLETLGITPPEETPQALGESQILQEFLDS
jgi:hypothetical protein